MQQSHGDKRKGSSTKSTLYTLSHLDYHHLLSAFSSCSIHLLCHVNKNEKYIPQKSKSSYRIDIRHRHIFPIRSTLLPAHFDLIAPHIDSRFALAPLITMPDLRRQVLESRKTISRKAASREGSRSASRASSAQHSRQSSRNASRQPSDDEETASLSDSTAWSVTSLDDLNDNPDLGNVDWTQQLHDVIEDLLERKRSSVQGREAALAAFCRISKFHYVEEEIRTRIKDLLGAFLKSIKTQPSERETTLALQALELLAISAFDNTIYENTEPLITRTIRDSTSNSVKAAAIHCLSCCAAFGGAGEDSIFGQMTFFLDIVASDGQSIDATDDPDGVTAAIQEWGFLATEIDDLEAESEEAVQIFLDQLNSEHSQVQIAAGENIALLYEKSYSPQEDYNDQNSDEEDDSEEELFSGDRDGIRLVKRYDAYHNTYEIERELQSLATVHSKRISKKQKKNLHSSFISILTTVENPRRGPMYNMAIDQDTGRHYGSRAIVKIGDSAMNIDRWWKWIRLSTLRRILRGGFSEHYYQGNRAVLDSLPVMMRITAQTDRAGARKAAKSRSHARKWAALDHSDEEI